MAIKSCSSITPLRDMASSTDGCWWRVTPLVRPDESTSFLDRTSRLARSPTSAVEEACWHCWPERGNW